MRPLLAALTFSLVAAPVARADETGYGAGLYVSHCAACHGMEATGDGPMAGLITIATPDLTQLAAQNDGVFPLARVVQTIDGRVALRGHGGPMLVFGQVLGGGSAVVDAADGTPIQTRGDIVAIAEYLATIQTD